jgi:hypothetical protein
MSQLQAIGSIFAHRKDGQGLSQRITAALVVEHANRLLDEYFPQADATQVCARFLRKDVLGIACASPVIASEVSLYQARLLEDLAKKFGQRVARRITFLPATYE